VIIAYPYPRRDPFESGTLNQVIDQGSITRERQDVARLKDVQYVSVTTGAYDIFLWVALPSPEELSEFLRTKIGGIQGVRRTETFVNLSIKKNPSGPTAR
jgi:Lrp/AsnC family transcriptional regulator, regulator for asnA, asnC and gidA